MSLHLAAYVAGTPYFVGAIYCKGGKRVRVFDRTKRWRQAALAMRKAGMRPALIAHVLRRPPHVVEHMLGGMWRGTFCWKKSNLSVAE